METSYLILFLEKWVCIFACICLFSCAQYLPSLCLCPCTVSTLLIFQARFSRMPSASYSRGNLDDVKNQKNN